jgi:phytoene dehydrogenase-like protein
MTASRDVVIIGGGHNGLVAAAYLARNGLGTLVCERRDVVGGAAVSEHPFGPDYTVTSLSYVVSLLPPDLVRDLRLASHGYHHELLVAAPRRVYLAEDAPHPVGVQRAIPAQPGRSGGHRRGPSHGVARGRAARRGSARRSRLAANTTLRSRSRRTGRPSTPAAATP